MRSVIAAAVALVALAVGAGAGIEHTILHGARVGRVHVSVGPDEVPGLSREDVQSSVETQLREAGIQITPEAPAYLHVGIDVSISGGCFATIRSSLVEDALLERNGLRVPAQSWFSGARVIGTRMDECVQNIPTGVERTIADFIEVYGAMNPRE